MPNCLKGCIEKYNKKGVRLPINAETIMPWVKVSVIGSGKSISVSNFSSQNSRAVVKSFQFGMSDGHGVLIEIVDEDGGNFVNFFNKIVTGNQDIANKYLLEFEYGWATADCDGKGTSFGQQICCPVGAGNGQALRSCKHRMMVRNISVNVSRGLFKFSIEGTDTLMDAMTTRSPATYGTDRNRTRLVLAIRKMIKETIQTDCQFVSLNQMCQVEPLRFRMDSDLADVVSTVGLGFGPTGPLAVAGSVVDAQLLGPLGVWEVKRRNPIQAACDWLGETITDNRRGIISYFDSAGVTKPTLVFMETNQITCENVRDSSPWNVGTYIVNGGSCLSGYTAVLCDNGWLPIHNLFRHKYDGEVACVDENGKLTWSKITNWFRSKLNGRKLLKIHTHNARSTNDGGIFTEDHLILTDRGYVKTSDLNVARDKVHSGTMMPGDEVHQAVLGMVLGDTSLREKSFAFSCVHCREQELYARHKADILGISNVRVSPTRIKINGKASPYWRYLRRLFYNDIRKIVPAEIIKDFSIISLAYLYMDDGSLYKPKKRAEIATCCFSSEEVDMLVARINDLGIGCCKRKCGKYFHIKFPVEQTKKLSSAVAPYVMPSMEYKLLPEDRGGEKKYIKFSQQPFYDTFDIIRCVKLESGIKWVYCLDVDKFHNFVTHSGVVHNCSPVLSFSPTIKYVMDQIYAQTLASDGAPMFVATDPCDVLPRARHQGSEGVRIPSRSSRDLFLGQAGKKSSDNRRLNSKANTVPASSPFNAEMRIQGDPSYDKPLLLHGHYCSIVYINPFRIASLGAAAGAAIGDLFGASDIGTSIGGAIGSSGCTWLARHGCNEQLSNTNWMITGVSHEIKEGSFVTTLRLRLLMPGYDIATGMPIGGAPNGPLFG